MGWIIFLIILIFIFGSSDKAGTKTSGKGNSGLSKKDIKRIQKERERAEMEAYEDMLIYLEAFIDD